MNNNINLQPTVFLDRDGTINFDAGYINHIDSFQIYPFAAEAIRLLNLHNFLVVIITNQSGIGRGFFDVDTLNLLHEKMYHELAVQGAKIDGLYFCPHDTSSKDERYKVDCDCRKPKAGMLITAMNDLPIDKNKLFFIGDKESDITAGKTVNAKTYLVETGYGKGSVQNDIHKFKVKPDIITENILTATIDILTNS